LPQAFSPRFFGEPKLWYLNGAEERNRLRGSALLIRSAAHLPPLAALPPRPGLAPGSFLNAFAAHPEQQLTLASHTSLAQSLPSLLPCAVEILDVEVLAKKKEGPV
jgi:hypothetical protein